MTKCTRTILIAALSAAVVLAMVIGAAVWLNRPQPLRPVDSQTLRDAITTERLTQHLKALQDASDANGGNRQAGRPGHAASIDYVEAQLKGAGYETQRQEFTYERRDPSRATLADEGAPSTSGTVTSLTTYEVETDFRPFARSATGSAAGNVTAVDVNLDNDRDTTSGCEASDFTHFPRGDIALLQRGTCRFDTKVQHATDAGASAVIVFNHGGREGLFRGDLGEDAAIPVLAATAERGAAWASRPTRLTLDVDTLETVTTENLIADWPGESGGTVVVGAHLDGVADGPGINDNGSGVVTVLETAIQLAKLRAQTTHGVRFAFWSGEEDGLHGSYHYVESLEDAALEATELYLNLDMVGSPNPTPWVYGGLGREGWRGLDHPVGETMADFLTEQGAEPDNATFEGSDHLPFLEAGIPVSGLYTGADEGEDGPADPCYHLACDRTDNIDPDMLGLMADALAHGVLAVAS